MAIRFPTIALLAVMPAVMLAENGFAAPACTLRHPAAPGDTLSDLASFYYGDPEYASSILIGTNSRTAEFPFIDNPFVLRKGDLCIPNATEAEQSRKRYSTYEKALEATRIARPAQEAHNLVVIPAGRPVIVASWIRAEQAAKYKDKAPDDTWVTVEPWLKEFCTQYSREHNGNREELTERLEKRIGLPPADNQTAFIRIRLNHPDRKTIFRPCSDPATSVAHCEAGPPSGADYAFNNWFMGQYYWAFGLPRPNLYPWTALGYTFDWEQADDGAFKRFGESEFVIPKGAPIEVLGTMSTEDYCR